MLQASFSSGDIMHWPKLNSNRCPGKLREDVDSIDTIFGRKDTLFVHLTLTNDTPFIYLPLDYSTQNSTVFNGMCSKYFNEKPF